MVAFAESGGCLRGKILRYFGDPLAPTGCESCGNCRPHALDPHERDTLHKILTGVSRSGERYGRRRLVAMLVGDTADLPPALASLSTAGSLCDGGSDYVDGWIDAAVRAGLIATSPDEYRTLRLSEHGRDVLLGRVSGVDVAPPTDAWRADARVGLRDSYRSRGGRREPWRGR